MQLNGLTTVPEDSPRPTSWIPAFAGMTGEVQENTPAGGLGVSPKFQSPPRLGDIATVLDVKSMAR
jgi:hypothetical protein